VRENLTLITALFQASRCGVQEVLVRPSGQVTVRAAQSMVNRLRSYRSGERACQLLSGRMRPTTSMPCRDWLVRTSSAST